MQVGLVVNWTNPSAERIDVFETSIGKDHAKVITSFVRQAELQLIPDPIFN
jgi:hypothetical protein